MKKNFDDKSIVIQYIQQMLNENYNSNVSVNGEYYKHIDMNYGLAHYIAKYLDSRYPILDTSSKKEYKNIKNGDVRDLTKPISIMNYFLCSNDGRKLEYNPDYPYDDETTNKIYKEIYNRYMILYNHGVDVGTIDIQPIYNGKYLIKNDLPLFSFYDKSTDTYSINNNIIFKLQYWNASKEICEIDDLVASYLVGRTITPKSPADDIYYAQKLLIRDREIERDEKGVWCAPGKEGTIYDFTQTVISYQRDRFDPNSSKPIFVTGYFDIFTEASARKELGDVENGIQAL